MSQYPHQAEPGNVTVLGPECFASADESVICWRGVNFYREPDDDELAKVFVVMDGMATEVPGEVRDTNHARPPVDRCGECGASTWDPGLLRHHPGCSTGGDD